MAPSPDQFSGTLVPPGTCLIHGSYSGSVCPGCSTTSEPFAGLPWDQQPSNLPKAKPMERGWECPKCGTANAPWIPTCRGCR